MSVTETKMLGVRLNRGVWASLESLAARPEGGSLQQAVAVAVTHLARPCEPWAQRVLCLHSAQRQEVLLEALARLIAAASEQNERLFGEREWEYLWAALEGRLWSGQENGLGKLIALRCREVERERGLSVMIWDGERERKNRGRLLGSLLRKLDCLSQAQAWALTLSIAHRWDVLTDETGRVGPDWWTLRARTWEAPTNDGAR